MHAMIIGAGATGKAAAIALAMEKHHADLFDERHDPGMAGGALMLWSNAVRALNALWDDRSETTGEAELRKRGAFAMQRMDFRTFEGVRLYSMPIRQLSEDAKAPSLLVDRQVLQDVLDERAGDPSLGITTHLGRKFWNFHTVGDQVEASFTNARPVRGDLLLGAEGGRSTVRSRLLGPPRYRRTGQYVAFGYSTAPSTLAPPGVCYCLMDAGHRFFAAGLPGWDAGAAKPKGAARSRASAPAPPKWRSYWGASVPITLASPGSDPRGRPFRLEALRKAFDGAAPDVTRILGGIEEAKPDPEDPKKGSRWWAVESRDIRPGGTWHRGRVGLLGDAAHLMTYDLGQGQAMGLEDAVELGHCIHRHPSDPTPALGALERARRHRVGTITELSYRAAQVSTPGSDVLAWLRDFATAHFYAPVNDHTMRFMLRGGPSTHFDAAIA
jgi:2-polyprenyl-6-methoxyphenol hydroxylase-like FAD-dependent oxidoreductase